MRDYEKEWRPVINYRFRQRLPGCYRLYLHRFDIRRGIRSNAAPARHLPASPPDAALFQGTAPELTTRTMLCHSRKAQCR